MNFVEKGVKIFILTTLSITFRGAAELCCIQFRIYLTILIKTTEEHEAESTFLKKNFVFVTFRLPQLN